MVNDHGIRCREDTLTLRVVQLTVTIVTRYREYKGCPSPGSPMIIDYGIRCRENTLTLRVQLSTTVTRAIVTTKYALALGVQWPMTIAFDIVRTPVPRPTSTSRRE